MYDSLRHGAQARLADYKRRAAKSLATVAKNHGTDSNLYQAYARERWRKERWITPHGMGFNATRFPDIQHAGGRLFADSGYLDHLREPHRDLPRDYGRGWYADAFHSETIKGCVAVLPSRKDGPRFLAYTKHSDADGITIDPSPYDDLHDAWRAADRMAECMAEDEREYSERWHAASEASEDRDAARDRLQAAHAIAREAVAALREGPGAHARGLVCRALIEARDAMREAIEAIHNTTDTIHDLGMQHDF